MGAALTIRFRHTIRHDVRASLYLLRATRTLRATALQGVSVRAMLPSNLPIGLSDPSTGFPFVIQGDTNMPLLPSVLTRHFGGSLDFWQGLRFQTSDSRICFCLGGYLFCLARLLSTFVRLGNQHNTQGGRTRDFNCQRSIFLAWEVYCAILSCTSFGLKSFVFLFLFLCPW